MSNDKSAGKGKKQHEDEEGGDGSGTEFTFVPRRGAASGSGGGLLSGPEDFLARKREKEALARETPWEASLRKERERKRARKKSMKEKMRASAVGDGGTEDEEDLTAYLVRAFSCVGARRCHRAIIIHS